MATGDRVPTLDARLRNWGNSRRGAYDPVDAGELTRAWKGLHPRHRDILRMVYLWHAPHEVVCRRMHIPRRPASLLELELAAARQALAAALNAVTPVSGLPNGGAEKNF